MKLINKVDYLFGTKKIPLFVYCGPEPHCLYLFHFITQFTITSANLTIAQLTMLDFVSRSGLTDVDPQWKLPLTMAIVGNSNYLIQSGKVPNVILQRQTAFQHQFSPFLGFNLRNPSTTAVLPSTSISPLSEANHSRLQGSHSSTLDTSLAQNIIFI